MMKLKNLIEMETAPVNTTGQVAKVDKPLSDNIARRKKKEEYDKEDNSEVKESYIPESDEPEVAIPDNYIDAVFKLTDQFPELVQSVDYEPEDGNVYITLNKTDSEDAVFDFVDALEALPDVESVAVDVYSDTDEDDNESSDDDTEVEDASFADIADGEIVVVSVIPKVDKAIYDAEFVTEVEAKESEYDDSGLYDDSSRLDEVKRIWKVNSRGKRRIKMKCKPGFKWNGKSCEKISGSALSKKRRAIMKMGRTKRAAGDKLKRRVKRLTKKAKRYRKSYGLK